MSATKTPAGVCGTPRWASIGAGTCADLHPEQAAVLEKFSAKISDELLDRVRWSHETRESCLLRFLRARQFDSDRAFDMFTAAGQWRLEFDTKKLGTAGAAEVLGCLPSEMQYFYPHMFLNGLDKSGLPIYIERTGVIDIDGLLSITTHTAMLHYHVSTIEGRQQKAMSRSTRARAAAGHKAPVVDAVFSILDLEGMGRHLICSAALAYVKDVSKIDQENYPELCGHMLIINAPSIFSAAWGMIKGFLDERTVSKIEIYSSPSEWKPRLLELIDADVLPAQYGGTLKQEDEESDSGPFPNPSLRELTVPRGKRVRHEISIETVQVRYFLRGGALQVSVEYVPEGAEDDASQHQVLVKPAEPEDPEHLNVIPVILPAIATPAGGEADSGAAGGSGSGSGDGADGGETAEAAAKPKPKGKLFVVFDNSGAWFQRQAYLNAATEADIREGTLRHIPSAVSLGASSGTEAKEELDEGAEEVRDFISAVGSVDGSLQSIGRGRDPVHSGGASGGAGTPVAGETPPPPAPTVASGGGGGSGAAAPPLPPASSST